MLRNIPAMIAASMLLPLASAGARNPADQARTGGRVTLVDDRMFSAIDAGTTGRDAPWRMEDAATEWRESDPEPAKVRVKVRPNRAMGRVSLTF